MDTGKYPILSTSPPAQTGGKPPGLPALRCRRRLPCRGLRYRPVVKELDTETGLYYYGARYLDPKTSRWLSGDPAISEYIPSAPVNDEAKKKNQNLPGMGGVFNHVNLHVYHYAGNNPVKYTDLDGNQNIPYFSPKEYFASLTRNNSSMKVVGTIISAFSGDRSSQAQLNHISREATRQIVNDTVDAAIDTSVMVLDSTAQTAGFVSGASGIIAVGASTVGQGEVASVAGVFSIGAGVIEVGALGLKATITGEQREWNIVGQKATRLGISLLIGGSFSMFRGTNPLRDTAITDQVLDFSSYVAPVIYTTADDLISANR